MPRRFVVQDACVLTQNAARDVLGRASVLVEDGRIARVSEARIDAGAARIINGAGMALMPGLVNAHSHIMCVLLRGGLGADRRLMDWRLNVMAPGQAAYAPEDAALATRLFACEAIRSGTTAVATNERVPIPLAEAMLEALEDSGLRSVFALSFNEIPPAGKLAERARSHIAAWGRTFPPSLKSGDEALAEIAHLVDGYHGRSGGRVRVWPGPNIPVYVKPETFREVDAWAAARGLRVSTHVAEDPMESEVGGLPVVQHLAAWGLLSERLVAGHCVHVSEEDVRLLREAGAQVVHLPSSNMYLGSGVSPVPRMLGYGIPVALGTDNANCNDMANMFWEVRLACLLHKGVRQDPAAITAGQALDMATRNGARALGLAEEIGAIEEGRRADMILLDMSGAHMCPNHHLPSVLAYQTQGAEVRWSWVDGEPLMEAGRLARVSEAEEASIRREAQAASAAIVERAGLMAAPGGCG